MTLVSHSSVALQRPGGGRQAARHLLLPAVAIGPLLGTLSVLAVVAAINGN